MSLAVIFYDVMADGYHTPLTKTQIAELFQAGRLGRNQPCKEAEKKTWRTIDELFPLLKYEVSGSASSKIGESASVSSRTWLLPFLLWAGGILALALMIYFFSHSDGEIDGVSLPNHLGKRTRPAEIPPATSYTTQNSRAAVKAFPSADEVTPSEDQWDGTSVVQPNSYEGPRPSVAAQETRLAQEHLRAEQWQREQAQATKERANAEVRERERQKVAGRNVIVPLGQNTIIRNVGSSDVFVKIHDNDVTSFDVWINGAWRREVIKQKGISGSRTDETLIYSNGRASLYYVWEISGTLNHCLLRVRDE